MQARLTSEFLFAAVTALLSAFALFLLWEGRAHQEQDRATGEMLADIAARASVDGLISRNSIELGVVANRLTGVERVAGVAIFTIENELLALSGTLESGTQFTHPIVLDDMVLGFARISLDPPSAEPDWTHIALSVLALLSVALLVAFWSHRIRTPTPRTRGESPLESPRAPAPAAAWQRVLVCNFHNQLSLSRTERNRIANRASALAERVGEIYHAKYGHLPGAGIVMTFSPAAGQDGAFGAVCATFLLADCLARNASPGEFRFGLHKPVRQPVESGAGYAAATADAALLAAVGRPGSIVASDAFFADVAQPERLNAEPFTHPMLDELNTSGSACHMITGLDEDHRLLIERQASHLAAAQDDAG